MLLLKILGALWASPLTLVAWLAARFGGARRVPSIHPREIAFVGGWFWPWWYRVLGIAGGTCGQVTIYLDADAHPRLAAHEGRHVLQCMALGPFAPVAYGVGLVVGACRGHAYRLNPLEVDARRAAEEIVR